jgi:superfamily II DNA or RNA helicase
MSLKNLNLKRKYRTISQNIIDSFFLPALIETKYYYRAVAYFSSSSLAYLSLGFCEIAKKRGKIKLIISADIADEDIDAIAKGYEGERSDKYYEVINTIIRSNLLPKSEFEKERFSLLSNLIEDGLLEIQVAFTKSGKGIFHEKLGIFVDDEGNYIAFGGSLNETAAAFSKNLETIYTFKSWTESENEVAQESLEDFNRMWSNKDESVAIHKFQDLIYSELKKFKNYVPEPYEIDKEIYNKLNILRNKEKDNLRDYQKEAIKSLESNNFSGIFEMATGTGKTFTALGASKRILEVRGVKINLVVVPFLHLSSQWAIEIEKKGYNFIECHSQNKGWEEILKANLLGQSVNDESDPLYIIVTNNTFKTEKFKTLIEDFYEFIFLIVDEAHNFGSAQLVHSLEKRFIFRLALTATIERPNIEETERIIEYFKGARFVFSLKDALNYDPPMLTSYFYYPIVTTLTSQELDEYYEISIKINKLSYLHKEPKKNNLLELLLIKRARLIASATNKLEKLFIEMEKHRKKSSILVYSGATLVSDISYLEGVTDDSELKTVDYIRARLQSMGMTTAKFVAEVKNEERKKIIESFKSEDYQALVAIRCLDEGVDIPSIKTAFIISSSTNPKEFIQRRGRLLRLYKGKEYAEIYDFITLPREISEIRPFEEDKLRLEKSLIEKELARIKEFSSLARNSYDSDKLIKEIEDAFKIYKLED